MRIQASLLASAVLLSGLPAAAQDVVPGVRSEVVRLDVVVTDEKGNTIPNLTLADFELREDGKPQRVTHFASGGGDTSVTSGESAPGSSGASATGASTPGEGRHVVVFVDDLHIHATNLAVTKLALHRFVREVLAPEDNVTFVTTSGPGGVERFSRDRTVLGEVIDRLVGREVTQPPAQASQMTPAQAELVLRGDSNALKLVARTLMDTPGTGFDPAEPRAQGTGRLVLGGLDREEGPAAEEAQRQAKGILTQTMRYSAVTLGRLSDVVRGLSRIPGRKICLLVSDGFLVGAGTSEELTRELQSVIDAATRAGAVVYGLDSRGLVNNAASDASAVGGRGRPDLRAGVESRAEQLYLSTLMGVANDTGGFLVRGTNDLASGLKRMLGDNDRYYVLAYESSNLKRDGRFRKIEVRLTRGRDYLVRTRKGYFAPNDKNLAPDTGRVLARPLEEAEVRAMLSADLPATPEIPVRLTADFLDVPATGAQGVVRAHVDLASLRWQPAGARRQAFLDAWGGVFDAKGQPVGAPFGRHLALDLSLDDQRRALADGFQYRHQIPLAPGRYEIRWVAAEAHTARIGGARQWLDVPDLTQKTLALSGVFLSTGTGGGDALQIADAKRRFKRSDDLYFQVYVYNAARDEKGASDVVLQAQIRSQGKVLAASKPRPAALETKDGALVPETNGMSLKELAPGDYELRVVVVDRKTNTTLNGKVELTVE
jgi:VWFA-related protein